VSEILKMENQIEGFFDTQHEFHEILVTVSACLDL